ncbi:hypothetical protein Tco_0054770, partial [Tanacetum coccineum]
MKQVVSLAWETISEIEHAFEDKQYQPEGILELFRKLHDDVQNVHEELAEYINTSNWNRPIVYYNDDDDEDYTIAITPVLSTKEPVDSLIMEDEHLDTILETESDEISSDDDSPYGEDIDYVDASLPDYELVSLEVVENVTPEDGEIEDDVLREKLSKIDLLIAKIEALKDNLPLSSGFVTKSPSTFPNLFWRRLTPLIILYLNLKLSALIWKRIVVAVPLLVLI